MFLHGTLPVRVNCREIRFCCYMIVEKSAVTAEERLLSNENAEWCDEAGQRAGNGKRRFNDNADSELSTSFHERCLRIARRVCARHDDAARETIVHDNKREEYRR